METTSAQQPAGTSEGSDGDREGSVQRFLERYGEALTAGDGKTVATMWEVPALVVGDHGVQAVSAAAEVETFFNSAGEQYRKQGIASTRPEITRLSWASPKIVLVEVRWPYLDDKGRPLGNAETSTYTLRLDERGQLRLRVALMHGQPAH